MRKNELAKSWMSRLQGFRKELALGMEQADRGQFVNGQKAFDKLLKKSQERRGKAA